MFHPQPSVSQIYRGRGLVSNSLIEWSRMRTYMSTVFRGARTVETRAEAEKVGAHEVGPFMMLPQRAIIRRAKHQASNRVPQTIVSLSSNIIQVQKEAFVRKESSQLEILRRPRSKVEVARTQWLGVIQLTWGSNSPPWSPLGMFNFVRSPVPVTWTYCGV